MDKKQYAVLGLGRFGTAVAKTLAQYDCDVIAVDKEMENVEYIAHYIEQSACLDFTNKTQLEELGVGECDVAILSSSGHLEDTILALMNLKELNVPYVIVKARSRRHKEILLKIGADDVILPEKEMGQRIAKNLISGALVDLISVDNDYSVVEINVPKKWLGKSILELDLRKSLGINVIGLREQRFSPLIINMDIHKPLHDEQRIVMVVENKVLDKNHFFREI